MRVCFMTGTELSCRNTLESTSIPGRANNTLATVSSGPSSRSTLRTANLPSIQKNLLPEKLYYRFSLDLALRCLPPQPLEIPGRKHSN